jgi:sugar lactone lactonase YvrE
MTRLSGLILLAVVGLSAAQDMPLHEIIKPGEDWKPALDNMPSRPKGGYSADPQSNTISLDGKPIKVPLEKPTACVVSLGGSQLLVADASERYVWAFRIEKDGSLGPGDRYCRMRVTGDERRKRVTPAEKYLADPSAMTADAAGRTYVATNLGIQIFDPTGRLCGVITAPTGRVTEMAFDGNQLFARAGDKVYVRTMLAEGRK